MTATLSMIAGAEKRGALGSRCNPSSDISAVYNQSSGGGRLLPGVEARVIKEDGSIAECGEHGELIVKGPAAALGYLNDEQA